MIINHYVFFSHLSGVGSSLLLQINDIKVDFIVIIIGFFTCFFKSCQPLFGSFVCSHVKFPLHPDALAIDIG